MTLSAFPSHRPFIDCLAAHVLERHGRDALHLSKLLILLPSRRACQAFRDACLRATDGAPLLLPRLLPLGDADEDWLLAAGAVAALAGHPEDELPPIPPLRRHLLLTRFIGERAGELLAAPIDVEQASMLAQALAQLLDDIARYELDIRDLAQLVPDELAHHWQRTVRVLELVQREWPRILEREKMQDAVASRNAWIKRLADHWQANPPDYPVIAAGSTGSQLATARLLEVIARLPRGEVILPGLDRAMPKAHWELLEETHPQFILKQLLAHMPPLQGSTDVSLRETLLSAALQPAEVTHGWRGLSIDVAQAMRGLSRIDCATSEEEARTIALILREATEEKGRRVAVVTHDRTLARRIAAELRRFGLEVDDSAGMPLSRQPAGVFLLLLAEMAAAQAAPMPLLSLLKHPLTLMGYAPSQCRAFARELEVKLLRGVRMTRGLSGLKRAAKGDLATFLERLENACGEFLQAMTKRDMPMRELLTLHLRAAEALAGTERLWAGDDGAQVGAFIADLLAGADVLGDVKPASYPGLLSALLSMQEYRRAYGVHPRLHILSPLEARLQHYDTYILAGLNEGSWPPAAEASPWMSRPMLTQFGLPQPERAVGQAAHDFFTLCLSPQVILTRSDKQDGSPTTPSRWLRRLDTLLHAASGAPYRWPALPYAAWQAALNAPVNIPALTPPEPRPPVAARPKSLSVTAIETWLRDPYAIYAKHVLGLKALKPVDQQPDAALFGNVVHEALEHFLRAHPAQLPPDALKELLVSGQEAFRPYRDRPAVAAFWWPRFEAIAQWIIMREQERRIVGTVVHAEVKGSVMLGDFTLTTRIDRLELGMQGAALVDYKTGAVPKPGDIASGIACQMPLEACIALKGTLENIEGPDNVGNASYWKLAGAQNEESDIKSFGDLVALAWDGLQRLIDAYNVQETPYRAVPDADSAPRYSDYTHLERQTEWDV